MDPKLQKFTYIERIEMEEKNRKRPAPNAYNLNKTDKQIKEELEAMKTKKRKIGDKRYFYEENEFNST